VYVLLELNCSVALMQTDITSNTFDVRIIVLFLYLMTNDLLLRINYTVISTVIHCNLHIMSRRRYEMKIKCFVFNFI